MVLDQRHIRAGRALIDATQEEMAKAAGLSLATLNNIEREVARPRAKTYAKIQQALSDAGVSIHTTEQLQRVDFSHESYLEEEPGTSLRDTLARLIDKNNLLKVQRAMFFCYETDCQCAALYLEGQYRSLIYKGGLMDTMHRVGLAELSLFVISCRKSLGANIKFASTPVSEEGLTNSSSEFSRIANIPCDNNFDGYLKQFIYSQDNISAASTSQDHPLFHVLKIF